MLPFLGRHFIGSFGRWWAQQLERCEYIYREPHTTPKGRYFQSMTRNVNKYLIQNSKYVYCLCIQHTIRFRVYVLLWSLFEERTPNMRMAKTWEKALKQFIYSCFASCNPLNHLISSFAFRSMWTQFVLFLHISQAHSMLKPEIIRTASMDFLFYLVFSAF